MKIAITKFHVNVNGMTADRQLGLLGGQELSKCSAKLRNVWKAGVFPTEKVRPTGRIRKSVSECMFRLGVLGGDGGWSIPYDAAEEALREIKVLQVKHEAYKQDLLLQWEEVCKKSVEDFRKEFPTYSESRVLAEELGKSVEELTDVLASKLEHAQPTLAKVKKALNFSYSVKVYSDMVEGEDALAQAIRESRKNEEGDLFTQLIRDTVKVADEVFSLLTGGGDNEKAVNRRTLRRAEEMLVSKVQSMAFLDSRLSNLYMGVQAVLDPLTNAPASKTLRVRECGDLIALLAVLSNEERLKSRLESLGAGEPLLPASAKQELTLVVDKDEEEKVEEVPEEQGEEEVLTTVAQLNWG